MHVLRDPGMGDRSLRSRAVAPPAVVPVLCWLPTGKRGFAVILLPVSIGVAVGGKTVVLALVVMTTRPTPDPGHR